MHRTVSTASAVALALLAGPASSQITVDVGPDPAPEGCTVFASVTNDTNLIAGMGGCPWRITDGLGQVVFDAECLIQELLVGPLGTVDYAWDQRDELGQLVPPGDYVFEVLTPIGPAAVPFQVGGIDANLFVQGTAALGTDQIGFGGREIALCSPLDPGALYQVLISATPGPGFQLCGLPVPLVPDGLFAAALSGAVIPNAFGALDENGASLAPLLPIPDVPSLVGLDLFLSFVVLDPLAPCPVVRSSPVFATEVAPGAQPF